ncbi:MAG: NAD(+)/NADH kinase [Clostridiales bacterium]|nr:NAD(+)/NADH kinase [Clostridiales bacterium]
MRYFYLVTNPSKEGSEQKAEEIRSYLLAHGASCVIGEGKLGTDCSQVPEGTDCVITLGGDGTLIQAARDLVGRRLPLMGINMGTLGYLTQVSAREPLPPVLDKLLEGNIQLETRMMLEGEINGQCETARGFALNEIVLGRRVGTQPLHFVLYVNGKQLNEYTADGMIVATPTGSTGYNLSAGGPIVTPGARLIVLTPICSHSLNSRSIVLMGEDRVDIRVKGKEDQAVVFDGDQEACLSPEGVLSIRRSPEGTELIRLKDISFLDNLRDKMSRV